MFVVDRCRNSSEHRRGELTMTSATQGSGTGGSIVSGPGSSCPIRGRDEQLDTITGFLERVRSGAGGVAIIEGAPGLAKTSLLPPPPAAPPPLPPPPPP